VVDREPSLMHEVLERGTQAMGLDNLRLITPPRFSGARFGFWPEERVELFGHLHEYVVGCGHVDQLWKQTAVSANCRCLI